MKNRSFWGLLISGVLFAVAVESSHADQTAIATSRPSPGLVIQAECIQAADGTALGFKLEVINTDADRTVVLVVRDDMQSICHVQLLDSHGRDVSVLMKKIAEKSVNPRRTYRHEVILPWTSHSWFISIPPEIRIDGKTVAIAKGHYTASLKFAASSFRQEKGEPSISDHQAYDTLTAALPAIAIDVDPKKLSSKMSSSEMSSSEMSSSEMLSSESLIERYVTRAPASTATSKTPGQVTGHDATDTEGDTIQKPN